MPDPQIPLTDRGSLESTFGKYQADTINQPDIPNPPYQTLPSPDSLFGTSKSVSPVEQAEQDIFSKETARDGKLLGGSQPASVASLTNTRYSSFNPDPNYDNEDAFALSQSWGDKAANGIVKMTGIAASTAISSSIGIINGALQWANTGKFSSFYDNKLTQDLDAFNKTLEDKFPHYTTGRERASDWYEPANIFTANFLFDKIIKNLGFSIGAAIPAGAVGKALQAVKLSSKLFALGETIAAIDAVELGSQLPRLQQLSTIGEKLRIIAGKSISAFGSPQVAGQETSGFLVKALASTISSSGEASLEAYNNLNEFRTNRIKEYKDGYIDSKGNQIKGHGYAPTGADLDAINEQASNVGGASFALNMALLSGTEYVQLPKIMSSTFRGEKALVNETIKDAETGLLKTALPASGLAKRFYQGRNIASLFFNEAEAFEEGTQFGIQKGTQDYYNKKYRGENTDLLSSVFEGVHQGFFTSEGLENTVLGGLSGALMTSGFVGRNTKGQLGIGVSGKIGERGWTGYGGEKATNTEEYVNSINNTRFYSYLKDGVEQSNRAVVLQQEREKEIRQGNILESKDLEFDYSHNYLANRIKWDRYDLVKDDINEARQEASTQAGFERLQLQGKAANTDTQQTFLTRLNNFERHAESVNNNYERLKNKYSGLTTTEGKIKYTPEVIDQMVYAASKIEDYDQRIPELSKNLLGKGIQVQQVLEEAFSLPISEKESLKDKTEYEKAIIEAQNGQEHKSPIRQALKEINNLNTISEVKDDLKQQLQDVIELSLRRSSFIKDFDNIKNNPDNYKDIINPSTPTNIATIKQRNSDGKIVPSDIEVGKEYSIASPGLFRDGNKLSINPSIIVLSKTLGGEFEVKLPDGSTTFLKPSEFKDYNIGPSYASPELDRAVEKIVDEEVKAKGLESLFSTEDSLQDKLNIINSLTNKVLVDAIQRRVKTETAALQKEIEERIAKQEKFKKDQELQKKVEATLRGLDADQNTTSPSEGEESLGRKKDLSFITSSGTSQKYENAAPNSPSRREQSLLLALSTNPDLAGKDIKTILVTKNTQAALGLEGIIDPAFPDAIRIVYIEVDPSGKFNYLDREGHPIIGSNMDINSIAYGTMHDESLSFNNKTEDSYTNKNNLDEKLVKENYKKFRDSVFAITPEQVKANPSALFTSFYVSRGLPNIVEPSSKNNLLDVKLITEDDLFAPIIAIPTQGKTIFGPENDSVNMPKGKPIYNYKGNLFFLNNRNLSEKEATNIAKVLLYSSRQLVETGTIPQQVAEYLKGVVYFKNPNGKAASSNQIYIIGDKLYIGETEFDFFNLDEPTLTTALLSTYTYVNNQSLLDFAKNPKSTPFEELTIENGVPVVSKKWPSYQHFLLQKRTDGTPAPLTTNIIVPQNNEELPIIQKYPILNLQALDTKNLVPTKQQQKVEKASAPKTTEIKPIVYDGVTINKALTSKGEVIEFKASEDGGFEILVSEGANTAFNRLVNDLGKTQEEAKALIAGIANNAILKDQAFKIQTPVEVKEAEAKEEQKEIEQSPSSIKSSSLEAKKADIEKRRQEELKDKLENFKKGSPAASISFAQSLDLLKANSYSVIDRIHQFNEGIATKFINLFNEINAKYNAELAALEKEVGILGFLLGLHNMQGIDNWTGAKDYIKNNLKLSTATATLKQIQESAQKRFDELASTQNKGSQFKPGSFDNSAKRLNIKSFGLQGSTVEEEAEVKTMLPQVDIVSLKNVINITGGGKAWGATLPHFIYVWENAPYGTRYHEAFEQVFNFILSKKEQKELYNEFKGRTGTFTTFENKQMPYSEASFLEAKEQLADEFAEFKTNKTLPVQPKAKNVLQKIWDFLKQLFTGKPLSVEKAFYTLAKNGYANAPIITPIAVEPQYKRTVVDTPEALVQDTISGMAAELFMKKWNDDAALLNQLEEEQEEATKTLFEQLYQGLSKYFEETGDGTLNAYFYNQLQSNPSAEGELTDLYQKVQGNWNSVKLQWGNYMADLKSFLKVFDVAFTITDDGEIELSNELDNKEERSQAEYNSDDKLYINAKNSASKIVKLLFATVADSEFVFNTTKNALGNTIKEYAGNLTKRDTQMIMPDLAPYAKLFNYTLHNASNINGIENIINKLRTVSSVKSIKTNANLQVLLNRVGFDKVDVITGEATKIGWANLPAPTRKILLKLENALSKQKPQFFVQYSASKREHRILATNISDRTQQLKELWIDGIKGSKFTTTSGNKIKFKPEAANEDDFVLLSNIGIPFTKSDFDELSGGKKTLFRETVSKIREDIKAYSTKFLPVDTNSTNIEFAGRLEKLAELYAQNIEGDTTESQHFNPAGKPTSSFILNNYISFILNDTNQVETLEEFKALNPQYNDLYMGDSYILNNLLFSDGKRTDYEISVAISEGKRSKGEGTPTSQLTYGERIVYEINNNLNNIYYTLLPADSSTEWGIKVRNILSAARFFKGAREEALEEYSRLMWNNLSNEIALAKDYSTNNTRNSISSLAQKAKGDNRAIGESLRFFKTILSPKLNGTINELIDNQGVISEELYPEFKVQLLAFIKERSNKTITNLKSYQLINTKKDKNEIAGLDTDFLKRNFNSTKISNENIEDLFFFREANYIFQNIEMHKFLFNDPAQYKDEEKRVKSFLSGREYTNQSTGLNEVLSTDFNKSGDYVLTPNEFGYKIYNNSFNVQTLATVKTTSNNIEEIEKALPGAAGKKYNDNDVADAQSWAEGNTYREMLYKSGGRLTEKQNLLHEWLMAYQRSKMLERGLLSKENYSEKLQKADRQLLKKPIPDEVLPPLKPIISGVRNEDNTAIQYLYKTSTAPLYYYFVEGTPAEDILLSMQKNNIGLLAMDSAHKVGQLKNHTPSLYNKEGKLTDDFTSSSVPVDYKYFGIQVETGGTKDYQTQGSQLTKLAVQNLMSNGVPIDYKGTNWHAISETEKLKSPIYTLVKKHNSLLSEMAVNRAQKVLDKLGIKKGEFGYIYEDRKKVADFILSELTRRELPHNMGVGIEVENNEFKSPLEANVNYKKIKELLWSVIENNITKPKVSGGPKILLSALGFENIKSETVNGKEVLTSSKFKFYTQKDGKTQACQIAIPFHFGTKILSQIENSQNIKFASQKEGFKHVLDYLNKTVGGRELLEGIGFRIPTQGLNSVDFFEVVEFLPPQMGDVTIFPSEITTKAGSDFDVDKMNMYLKNYYLDRNGYPKTIPFYGTDSNAKQKLADELFKDTIEKLTSLSAKDKLSNYFNLEEEDIDFEASALEEQKLQDKLFIQSLENEYYRTIKDILSLEQNFARLITPNDANQLKAISRNIEKLKEKSGNNYTLTDSTRFVDSDFVSLKRHLFLIMKQAVGVAAVANTNLALNQVADFRMVIPEKLIKKNFAVRFKYNNTNDGTLSLSETTNKFGDWLSDLHSQAIDGTVDVAKDEWLANLLGSADAFSPLLYMFKLGISPKSAALFINQPAIQHYLKLKGIYQNVSKIAYWVKPKFSSLIEKEIQKSLNLSPKQVKSLIANKPSIYSDESMEQSIVNNNNEELQIQMLSDYLGFEQLAKDLFLNVQGYNYDTSRFTSPEVVEDKKLQYQTAIKTPSIEGQTDNILKSSFIGTIKNVVESTNNALSGLLNTQQGIVKRLLNKTAVKLSIQFFSKDNKIKYLQKAENSLIDYLAQTQAEYGGWKLNQLIPALFLKEGNIAQLVKEAQKNPILQENPILRNIETVEDPREGYPSYIKLIEQDYDSYTSNVWTAAFRELKDSNIIVSLNGKDRTMSQIFDYMMISQILQYGSARTRNSFLHLIPNENYTELIANTLKNINNVEDWWNNDLFYKNNYLDDFLVPEAELEDIDEFTQALPTIDNLNVNNLLTERGYENVTIIKQPYDRRNYPFLKVTTIVKNSEGKVEDRTNKVVSLYRRIDAEENTPISIQDFNLLLNQKETKLLYVKVNKLGTNNLNEYSDTSYLPQNKPFKEILNDELSEIIGLSGMSIGEVDLTNLVSSDEFDDNFSLDDDFEEFKNKLPRKNCK